MYLRYVLQTQSGGSNIKYTYSMSKRFLEKPELKGTDFYQDALNKRKITYIGRWLDPKTFNALNLPDDYNVWKNTKHLAILALTKYIDWEDIENNTRLFNQVKFTESISDKLKLSQIISKIPEIKQYFPYTINIKDAKSNGLWILKPIHGSLGQGIEIVDKITERKDDYIAQKYISNPLLINGTKFDFRVFLLYTQDGELYIYNKFYLRFALKKYTLDSLDKDIHVTNVSGQQKDLRQMDSFFYKHYKYDVINKIKPIVKILFDTLDKSKCKCYQLLGMDVMLDSDMNLHIIEFNRNPGLTINKNNKQITKLQENLIDDIFRLTIDKVFPNDYQTDRKNGFELIKNYQQAGGSKYTYAISRQIPREGATYRHVLNLRPDIKDVGSWSNDKNRTKNHLYIKTFDASKWEATEYRLFNHFKFFDNIINKKKLSIFANKIPKYFPYTTDNLQNANKYKYWIIKPERETQGRGIKILTQEELLKHNAKQNYIIQRYIENPLLINGCKFDCRLYLLYTQNNELFLYNRFIIRLNNHKYTLDDLNTSIHITNLHADNSTGHLDTLLYQYYNIDVLTKVKRVLIKLFDMIPKNKCNYCYQLCGFDIMFDDKFNLYFIEFNGSPGLYSSNLDIQKLKYDLIDDMFRLTIDKVFPNNYQTKRTNEFELIKTYIV